MTAARSIFLVEDNSTIRQHLMFLREGNGLAVVNWCNGREPHQRVVVLTNYAREDARRRCLDAGADRVFDKSIELDEFFEFCSTDLGA